MTSQAGQQCRRVAVSDPSSTPCRMIHTTQQHLSAKWQRQQTAQRRISLCFSASPSASVSACVRGDSGSGSPAAIYDEIGGNKQR